MERIEEKIPRIFPTIVVNLVAIHNFTYHGLPAKKLSNKFIECNYLPTADRYTAEFTMIDYNLKYYFIK